MEIKPELQKNILKFGYGINYKYEGMLAHSFDRFYVITKFILPTLDDLKLSPIRYDKECNYLWKLDDQDDDWIKENIKDLYMYGCFSFCLVTCKWIIFLKTEQINC